MIRTWGITNRFMSRELLFWVACLALAGALMLPGTSFGAWVADSFNPNVTCVQDTDAPCIRAVAVQPDGKFLIGGYIYSVTGATSTSNTIVVRYNANGTLDTTFAAANLDDAVDAIAIQSDGKILIGGHFGVINTGPTTTVAVNHIARLNSNGTLDTTFTASLDSNVLAIAVQQNGLILVGGDFKEVNGILNSFFARLTSTGALDNNFYRAHPSSTVRSIIPMDASSQILLGGQFKKYYCNYWPVTDPTNPGECVLTDTSLGLTDVNYIVRVSMADGSLDTGFMSSINPLNEWDDKVYTLSLLSNGQIMVGGAITDFLGGITQNYLARLNADGSQDTSFLPAITAAPGNMVNAVAADASGNIITGGTFTMINGVTRNFISRVTTTAFVDPNFAPSFNNSVNAVVAQTTTSNIITAGSFTVINGVTRNNIARIYDDGKRTTTTSIVVTGPTYGTVNGVSVVVTATTGTATGNLGLRLDSGATTTVALSNGSAVFSFPTAAVGDHSLYATYAGTSTYAASSATGTLTVTKAILSVSANNVTRPYLASNPVFTPSYATFANGENASVVSGSPVITTPAIATSPVGTYPITVTDISGLTAANYSFAIGNPAVLTVTKAATTTSVSSNSTPTAYGNSVIFTATVTGNGATGTVTFNDGGVFMGMQSLSNGTATYTANLLSGGTHTITAVYSGDTNFNGSTSSSFYQTISKQATTASIVSNTTSTTYGSPVTFTATVTSNATGTVTFKDGATTIGTAALSGNTAVFSTSTLSIGGSPHSVTATYNGDTNYAASGPSSPPASVTITQASSNTSVVSNATPTTYGSTVTFTATVTSTGGVPTGSVTFYDNASPIGSSTLSSGIATFSTNTLGVASHPITAVYSGDTNYATSTSSVFTQNITQASSTTNLVSSSNPALYGSPVSFTATVIGAGATGTITFKDGASTIASSVPLSNGTATYTTSTLTVAGSPHTITAVYSSDTNYAGSTSGPVNQTINLAQTTTAVASNSTTTTYGSQVTFTATVSTGSTGTTTGTVTFNDNGSQIGSSTLSGGIATFSTNSLGVGSHPITASYGGDTNFAGSTSSPALTETINKASTTAVVASSNNSSTYGQAVTFTATVTSGGGTPTGSVTFNDGVLGSIGSGVLSSGTASLTISTLNVSGSPHSITAVYNGDTNFSGTTSGAISQTVNKAGTTMGVIASAPTATYGNTVTFTATVTGAGATGTVTFTDGVTTIGTGNLSNGIATFATNTLGVGLHSISAAYSGDTNYILSNTSASAPVQVNPAATMIGLTSDMQISAISMPVTFTATVTSTGGIPTGSVTFSDNGSIIGSGTLSGGVATLVYAFSNTLPHSVTAQYAGGTNFYASPVSSPLTQTVVLSMTTTSFTLSGGTNPSTYGTTLTFSSAVTGTGGTPSGTVTFRDGTTIIGTSSLTNGSTTFSTNTLGASASTHALTATYNGDANFGGSVSPTLTQQVDKATQTINFVLSQPTKTYGDAPFGLSATVASTPISSGLTVTFSSSNTNVATINGNMVTIVGTGTATITAHQAGDSNYNTAPDVQQTLTVNKANQTITFNAPAVKTYGDADFALGASASSGLTVAYGNSNPSIATVTNGTVHIVSAGTTTITVSQAGDGNYNAATSVIQTLTVNKANQTITFNAPAAKTYGDADFALGASASSGLAVAYGNSNPAVATVTNGTVHIVSAGTTTITVSQTGDGNYNAATSVIQTLTVNKANQTITYGTLPSKLVGDPDFSPGATVSSGLTVTYDSSDTSVATIVNGNIHVVGNGTATITAHQAGDGNHNAAADVAQTMNVVWADGKFTPGDTSPVNSTDALKALRIAAGIDTPTANDLAHGDVAPLASGKRVPDGKIDLSDVMAILRKSAGLPSW